MKSRLWMLASFALAVLAFAAPAGAANMIGNCEVTGTKGEMPIIPAKPGQLTVQVSLPAPIWWNGDTPESIKDGFEYCLAANIAWRAGFDRLEVVNVGWDPLVTGQTRDFDLALSQISITDERKKVVDFSIPYFSSDLGVIVRQGTSVDAASIKQATVGVQQGTTAASFATDKLGLTKLQVYPELGDMFTALAAGQVDAALTDTAITLAQEVQTGGKQTVVGQYATGEAYGAIYPKGSLNRGALDKIIQSLIDDGTVDKLADKYLASVWGKNPAKVTYFKP